MIKKPINNLSAENLIRTIFEGCQKIPDTTTQIKAKVSLPNFLMSGFAVFSLKYPSLLQFDNDRADPLRQHNLNRLYHIEQTPSDSGLRQRLDELNPVELRPLFTKLFSLAQRHKVLEGYSYLEGHYLISLDGTGYFSSHEVHCENCCEKKHKNGTTTYYHQMLSAVLVHPDRTNVIPFCPEAIYKQDGAIKNDCERNAAKRLLKDLKREHPHLKAIIIEDGLASNAPHIKLLQELNYRYILGAKPKDHKWLFDWVDACQKEVYEFTDTDGVNHHFEYVNDVPLNESNEDVRVNFLKYCETKPNGKKASFTWVTNITITNQNCFMLMRGGRARWKIENETFNTLKNQGYHFEHNFGHGNKHLSHVMALLMMLAFLVDELQFIGCKLMQAAKTAMKSKVRLWQKMRSTFDTLLVKSWSDLWSSLAFGKQMMVLVPDTS